MSTGFSLNKIYRAGYCTSKGVFADKSLGWQTVKFYARSFLLSHPIHGLILVDTGYGRSLVECMKRGIYSLYDKLIPFSFSPEDCLISQLKNDGISLNDLAYLLITHYHPDHIGALPAFKDIPWIYRKDTLDELMSYSRFKGLRNGFIHDLIPPTPTKSIPILTDHFSEMWHFFPSHDVFGDGSLHLIDLPGHARGQMGVVFGNTFLAADATWGGKKLPNSLGMLLQENPFMYRKTFKKIQDLDASILILPTHTIEELHE